MLGYFTISERGKSDLLIADLVGVLQARGMKVAGTIQVNSETSPNRRSMMQLDVLGSDQRITITQDLGPHATGCKLDPAALEDAAIAVDRQLTAETDVLVLAKFGKQERDGQGFRDVIVRALDMEKPVLLSVNPTLESAFLDFAGEFAKRLDADATLIADWISAQR